MTWSEVDYRSVAITQGVWVEWTLSFVCANGDRPVSQDPRFARRDRLLDHELALLNERREEDNDVFGIEGLSLIHI